MQLTIEMPENIANRLGDSPEAAARKLLEKYAIEGYRALELSLADVREILGFSSRWESEAFLRSNGAPLHYDVADFEQDVATLRKLLNR
jgi:predicted HTH domain antitoxin